MAGGTDYIQNHSERNRGDYSTYAPAAIAVVRADVRPTVRGSPRWVFFFLSDK